ncbi:MAG TPA: 16S rRNA (guanine(527)-N(7))-methyltransferase RsmG [Bacteroidia bacterium]|jgi:16S rRNA (guanine527-N7)-methyltransferase|nr:16S rRNA (guanine(527)-N(7))-methyltransferase RsmG [Bacteroidia bacterium]
MQGAEIIFSYFPDLSELQKKQFSQLYNLYKEWNEKINVVSRKDIEHLYVHHVLHSLGIAKVVSFKTGTKILDVGTGGGFPGIPLAIMFPECKFHLVDSIGKKITVVNGVAESLGLKNVNAQQIRAEELRVKYDFVVSRAVTDLSVFVKWVEEKFAKQTIFNELSNGILCLKGGDLTEELKPFKKEIAIFELKHFFKEEFFETKKVVYLPV